MLLGRAREPGRSSRRRTRSPRSTSTCRSRSTRRRASTRSRWSGSARRPTAGRCRSSTPARRPTPSRRLGLRRGAAQRRVLAGAAAERPGEPQRPRRAGVGAAHELRLGAVRGRRAARGGEGRAGVSPRAGPVVLPPPPPPPPDPGTRDARRRHAAQRGAGRAGPAARARSPAAARACCGSWRAGRRSGSATRRCCSGRTKTLRVKLSRAARRKLARKGRLRAEAIFEPAGGAGRVVQAGGAAGLGSAL